MSCNLEFYFSKFVLLWKYLDRTFLRITWSIIQKNNDMLVYVRFIYCICISFIFIFNVLFFFNVDPYYIIVT